MSGIGTPHANRGGVLGRYINAIPALGYYEIFKTYYANKQEDDAYVITNTPKETVVNPYKIGYGGNVADPANPRNPNAHVPMNGQQPTNGRWGLGVTIEVSGYQYEEYEVTIKDFWDIYISLWDSNNNELYTNTIGGFMTEENYWQNAFLNFQIRKLEIPSPDSKFYQIVIYDIPLNSTRQAIWGNASMGTIITKAVLGNNEIVVKTTDAFGLTPFKLQNIDDFRMKILSWHTLNVPFEINSNIGVSSNGEWNKADANGGLPYTCLVDKYQSGKTLNQGAMNGLCIKTYQSDIYNNWVQTSWIDGPNGIAQLTAVATTNGKFLIDSLNQAEKLYNLLNRIAVSDGTYESWQDVVYTELPKMHIETPIYLGGMSNEVVFEEIVQNAPATTEDGTTTLGTLGGRGTLVKRKGGNVIAKCNEACFIIGIVSLTPRIYYTQGNEFYLTDLLSMDDYHKPALDGIGYQNLIGERLAWWDTEIDENENISKRSTIGKIPAWMEYMTAVDKAYGDFADESDSEQGKAFMILGRRYEPTDSGQGIKDATTYVDPSKFNYAFAYTELEAQNFWVQIRSKITARRFMSAKQIPNI